MLRTTVIFFTLLLLWWLLGQANDYLTPLHVYIFAGGLFVTFAALRLPLRAGLAAVLLGGMLCDANAPIPPDLRSFAFSMAHAQTLLFAFAFAAVYRLRDRMARDESLVRVLVAVFANLGIFLGFSFIRLALTPLPGAAWGRLFVDLIFSQAVVALVAPWFFALQGAALTLARTEPVALN